MADIRQTPIRDCHQELDAKMAPFAGWQLPINYPGGILAEHRNTREGASIFDICHMGEIRIAGPGVAAALDRVLARAVGTQAVGSCRYNFLLNAEGGILDDLVSYRMAEEDYLLVVNAGTTAGDFAHLRAEIPAGVQVENLSDDMAKIDLQGPESARVLEALGIPAAELPKYFHWIQRTLGDDIPCIISRTGYTGELGYELYCRSELAIELWGLLLENENVEPAGLGARDTLRLEAGLPLYGHELSTDVTPLEAGFGAIVKLDDGRDFIGRDALLKKTPARRLIGIKLEGRRASRAGDAVLNEAGETIGTVTSGAFGPTLGYAVALALVQANTAEVGAHLLLGASRLAGEVVALPFYRGSVRAETGAAKA